MNSKIYGNNKINHATFGYPREHMKFNNHVQKTRNTISMMKIIDVFATLQLTFPKQKLCVFSILSKIMINNDNTEITKNTSAGVHNDCTLFTMPSIKGFGSGFGMYIIIQYNNSTTRV